jgi:hypothetical protein
MLRRDAYAKTKWDAFEVRGLGRGWEEPGGVEDDILGRKGR